jgi:hypothetical protein
MLPGARCLGWVQVQVQAQAQLMVPRMKLKHG